MLTIAATEQAEAMSNARAIGVQHGEVTEAAVSSQIAPGAQGKTATQGTGSGSRHFTQQGTAELSWAAMGATAASITRMGYASVSASNGMPLSVPKDPRKSRARVEAVSRGQTMDLFTPKDLTGVGKQKVVQVASAGANLPPAVTFSHSQMGDGPNAISHAGQAVAASFAGSGAGLSEGWTGAQMSVAAKPQPDAEEPLFR